LGTLRGRVGYAAGPALFYVTGGLAYGGVERNGNIAGRSVTAVGGVTVSTFAGSYGANSARAGWTVGAGGEARVSDKLTAKAEYLYVDLGSVNDSFNTVFLTGGAGVSGTHTIASKVTEHIFRVGVNYKLKDH
jgi:outer membrane immunogenic protein